MRLNTALQNVITAVIFTFVQVDMLAMCFVSFYSDGWTAEARCFIRSGNR
jgi:hypothetical protein